MVLPVVERELRVAARTRTTYRTRLFTVVAMLVGFGFAEMEFLNRNPTAAEQGRDLFQIFSWLAFAFAALAGLVGTADCISSEKREGTLGLLFLTDLKGYDVICGKLAANSVAVIYGLLASVPILSIPILMGGVAVKQFVEVAVMLLTVLAVSCALGIFISTHSRNERKAMVFAVLAMLAILFLPILAAVLLENQNIINDVTALKFANFSPVFSMVLVLPPTVPTFLSATFLTWHLWITIAWLWLLIAFFLVRSARKAPLSWQETERAPNLLTRPIRFQIRKWRPARAILDWNPYQWLALRGETTPRAVWGFSAAMFVIWLIAVSKYGRYMSDPDTIVPLVVLINGFLKIWIVGEASRRFIEDRQNNALELILTTPLKQQKVIQGQWRALIKLFGWPLLTVAIWESVVIARMNTRYQPRFVGTLTGLFLLLDAIALAWAGMWLGLKFKGRVRVMITVIGLVLVLPALGAFLSQQLVSIWTRGIPAILVGNNSTNDLEKARIEFVTIATVLFNLIVIAWARLNLLRNFRRLATERFGKA